MADLLKSKSKFLSLILRHKPELIGLDLDPNGWASVEDLISKAQLHGSPITVEEMHTIVTFNDKQRFALSPDQKFIRAHQGHSLQVDLQLQPAHPPVILYHGTAERNLKTIKLQGILKGRRHYVHLSASLETAVAVGSRHGKAIVLEIDAQKMMEDNYLFFKTANGVWLTDFVPHQYLRYNAG
ncbi:MAG TPA: RNA 2'-phosphotransferase [Flavisolibacter sp.]